MGANISWSRADSTNPNSRGVIEPNGISKTRKSRPTEAKPGSEIATPFFPFNELPLELALRIACEACAISQMCYRSLVLTSSSMRNLIRLDGLSCTTVEISYRKQIQPFLEFLQQNLDAAQRIQYLWFIQVDSNCSVWPTFDIIGLCPNIRALACHAEVLQYTLVYGKPDALLSKCVYLTLKGWWKRVGSYNRDRIQGFYDHVEALHLIGHFNNAPPPRADNPKMPSLRDALISTGRESLMRESYFTALLECPEIKRVGIITQLKPPSSDGMADWISTRPKLALIHRPRRWTERKIFRDMAFDPENLWTANTT